MATAVLTSVTTEDLLAMPADGMERWLIRGELREKPMTVRNRFHSILMASVSFFLRLWLDQQPAPRGRILCGDAGFRLRRDLDTALGIDVAYISAELAVQEPESTIIEGVPILAGEILSPSDRQEEIEEKIDEYLAAGVSLVWIINPYRRTVLVCKPGSEPVLVNVLQVLSGDPELPGFRVPVARLFD